MTHSRESELSPNAVFGVLFAIAVILMMSIGLLYELRMQDAEQSIDRLRTEVSDNRIEARGQISDLRNETRSEASDDRISMLSEISDLRLEIGRAGR